MDWCYQLTPSMCMLNIIGGEGGGGDVVRTMPRCVCPKVKDMGPFLASRESNE